MKKYTYMMVFSLFALAFISTAYAGGGFEDYTLNPDGTVNVTMQAGLVSTTTADGVTYDENGNIVDQKAAASSALAALSSPGGIGIVVLLFLIILGAIYWSYKRSKPINL